MQFNLAVTQMSVRRCDWLFGDRDLHLQAEEIFASDFCGHARPGWWWYAVPLQCQWCDFVARCLVRLGFCLLRPDRPSAVQPDCVACRETQQPALRENALLPLQSWRRWHWGRPTKVSKILQYKKIMTFINYWILNMVNIFPLKLTLLDY